MMLPKTTVFIATSLDGFIARENGDLDWLLEANKTLPPEEDGGFHAFMDKTDAIIMGRTSFEKVLSFNMWPYGDKPIYVLSRQPRSYQTPYNIIPTTTSPQKLLTTLAQKGYQHIYIDGGKLVHNFLTKKLINDIIITLIPTTLGTGIPLFSTECANLKLSLISTKTLPSSFLQLHYQINYN